MQGYYKKSAAKPAKFTSFRQKISVFKEKKEQLEDHLTFKPSFYRCWISIIFRSCFEKQAHVDAFP